MCTVKLNLSYAQHDELHSSETKVKLQVVLHYLPCFANKSTGTGGSESAMQSLGITPVQELTVTQA